MGDYSCVCPSPLLWDDANKLCMLVSVCDVGGQVCSQEGTEKCLLSRLDEADCHCKQGYEGSDCSQLIDACEKRINPVSGSA
ncbi:unnamed protein product [Protopolystoma xenopodis]|uniref:EGF-like domain-containing protein n=1 Tax=Protopolystoma xenopodis TaxID=117903 RepID=A0A3S5FFV9_9PLAT|nr:unnamed protein product [Protopolystoma xenopodis]